MHDRERAPQQAPASIWGTPVPCPALSRARERVLPLVVLSLGLALSLRRFKWGGGESLQQAGPSKPAARPGSRQSPAAAQQAALVQPSLLLPSARQNV